VELILIPSFVAICLKLAIFFRYQHSLTRNNIALCIFFVAVFLWNLIELIFLDGNYTDQVNFFLLICAYCSIIFLVHAFLSIAIEYSKPQWQRLEQIKLALNLFLGYLVVSVIFDREFIAGFEPNGFTLTKISGDRYWIFQMYLLAGVLTALALLVKGIAKLRENLDKQRCLAVLLAAVPAAAVGIFVVISQALGTGSTSTIFQSLGFTLMLGVLVYAEEKSRLFKLLTFIPFTRKRKLHKKILAQITDCIAINDDPSTQQSINLKQMMREFEGLVVEHVLDYYGGNQKRTASALGVSEATVSRRARAVTARKLEQESSSEAGDLIQDSIRITP
jgi:DNA-binding protein Fis